MAESVAGDRRPSESTRKLQPQPSGRGKDRRYHHRRWSEIAKAILRRDMYVCRITEGCTERATVADHIIPSSPTMPDSLFFSPANLRAGCRACNLDRAAVQRMKDKGPTVATKDYT
jgi:5-methylcytosine-specific restriction endonuclease McrA